MAFGFAVKRLALLVGAMGASAALVSAASFAMFNSTANFQENTFAAGTVQLNNASPTATCNVGPMEPGDSTPAYQSAGGNGQDTPCTYSVTYDGSLAAWIGLQIENDSPNQDIGSSVALENPSDPNALQVSISDTCGNTIPVPAPNGEATTTDLILGNPNGSCANANSDGSVNDNWSDTYTVNYYLPLAAGNQYQGGTAEIELDAIAVQASNNPLNDGQPANGWGDPPAMNG
jgi:predicted ribosomally synthesized peptide with SipW-like signal peptide